MRPAKLHELRLPSKYALWRKYVWEPFELDDPEDLIQKIKDNLGAI